MVRVLINCRICKNRVFYELSEEEQDLIKEKAIYWPCPLVVRHLDHYLIIHLDDAFKNRGTEYAPMQLERDPLDFPILTPAKSVAKGRVKSKA